MISLFLNTSSKYLNIGILEDNIVLNQKFIKLGDDMAKYTLFYIDEMLKANKIDSNDVDEIICVNGPGSFTGIRIGVTIAKMYAWSLNKKLVGVSNLFCMASSVDDDYIIPIIDSRRGYVYAGIYNRDYKVVMNDCYIKLEDLMEKVKELNGKYSFVSLDDFDFSNKYIPNLNNLFKVLNKEYVDPFKFEPIYLKKTEAEEKLSSNN